MRLLEVGMGPLGEHWRPLLAILAALSLVIGNLVALAQTNLKRMLAYSTVSHVGFLFVGLAGGGAIGDAAAMFYALSYAIMASAAFGAIILLSRRGFEADRIDAAGDGGRGADLAFRDRVACSMHTGWHRRRGHRKPAASG